MVNLIEERNAYTASRAEFSGGVPTSPGLISCGSHYTLGRGHPFVSP